MKGIVFTEFLEMVEDKFGFEIADNIVSESKLESGGVYTAVGTYHHSEMVQLVTNLSQKSQVQIPELLKTFGRHLFGQFVKGYGRFFTQTQNAFEFLSGIENYIHVEVRKLYPDAELPKFEIGPIERDHMELIYKSERGMADFAEGLIEGCISHFGEDISIRRENINGSQEVKFLLDRKL
ncbi:MAG: heme NO-binding domain-containing protein [Bacteroidota bacterium]